MYLRVYNDDGTIEKYEITKKIFRDSSVNDKISYIASTSKKENALNIFKSYFNNGKSILLDDTNKILIQKLQELQIPCFDENKKTKTIFDEKDFSFIYFTSGTTGEVTAALKTRENLELEIKALSKIFNKYNIKRVIVTVPFIHIYGSLAGIFYPYLNDVEIILKEHFLPNDLLEMCEDNSLVVTTPLYIKALNKIASSKDLSKVLFLSSTAPLEATEAEKFHKKFQSDVMQLFGSTETGGIAYKFNNESLWMPLDGVKIETNSEGELKVISPFVSKQLYINGFKNTDGMIQTFDFIEKCDEKFKLIGRSSQILKIAGKRYSTVQIENILELDEDIQKALVFVKSDKDSLRGEILDITLETQKIFSTKEIKNMLRSQLSNLKFSMDLKCVEKIPLSNVGKKMRV